MKKEKRKIEETKKEEVKIKIDFGTVWAFFWRWMTIMFALWFALVILTVTISSIINIILK